MNKLRLMANLPIYVDGIPIYSPTLLEIADKGQQQYILNMNYCTVSKEQIEVKLDKEIEDYDVLLSMIYNHGEFLNYFLEALFYFTKMDFAVASSIVDRDIVFVNIKGDAILHRNNYHTFMKIIKYVNCIDEPDMEELDEFDRLLLEREKKVLEAQNKNVERPNFEDLISAVANMDGNGLNIINIWQLNIYQFYEQLKRGQMKEGYRLAIKQLLAGAKSEDVEVKSYLSNIE